MLASAAASQSVMLMKAALLRRQQQVPQGIVLSLQFVEVDLAKGRELHVASFLVCLVFAGCT